MVYIWKMKWLYLKQNKFSSVLRQLNSTNETNLDHHENSCFIKEFFLVWLQFGYSLFLLIYKEFCKKKGKKIVKIETNSDDDSNLTKLVLIEYNKCDKIVMTMYVIRKA